MGKIVVSYKIFPIDVTVDFENLKQTIEENLPKHVSIYGYATEPVAFGLNALIAHIIIPEDETGIINRLEQRLSQIDEISQIQTLMIRRTR